MLITDWMEKMSFHAQHTAWHDVGTEGLTAAMTIN